MKFTQPMSTTAIRQIEFQLAKAEHGMGMPYDAENVARLRGMLRKARKRKLSEGLRARRQQSDGLGTTMKIRTHEPPRVCRRLQLLRRWSHEQADKQQVFA